MPKVVDSMIQIKSIVGVIALILGGCSSTGAVSHKVTRDPIVTKTVSTMREHYSHIKSATVRILVNGRPSGSGFLINETGTVVTCFHVVQLVTPIPGQPGGINLNVQPNIQVELPTGQILAASVSQKSAGAGFQSAYERDYFLLEVGGHDRPFLRLGSFSDVEEGATLLCSGYPWGIPQAFVSSGMLSTKFKSANLYGSGRDRDSAWIDLTMNKGNSGGPIVRVGQQVEDDVVIGIATFTLTPFGQQASELVAKVNESSAGGSVQIMGIDPLQATKFTAEAIAAMSVGLNGCVAIDYCKTSAGL